MMKVYHEPFKADNQRRSCDMHTHTSSSDGLVSAKNIGKLSEKYNRYISITDHNTISGSKIAREFTDNIIPGIEISAIDGPHLLVYFDRFSELSYYYDKYIRDCKLTCPHTAVSLKTEKIIRDAKSEGGFVIAAHPYGYGVSVRGVMKAVDLGLVPKTAAEEIDGLEIICSGLTKDKNKKAEDYAFLKNMCITGGSDAHVLREYGRAGNIGYINETPLEVLEDIRSKKSDVFGVGRTALQNIAMAACMTPRYIPYAVPVTIIQIRQMEERAVNRYNKSKKINGIS